MALDNGYNSAFRDFVEFARRRGNANDAKTVVGIFGGGLKSPPTVTRCPFIAPSAQNPTATDCKIAQPPA